MTAYPPDQNTVEDLVAAMLDGMSIMDGKYSSSELSSACFTMTLRVVNAVLKQNPTCRQTLRQAIGVLLLACADEGRPN